MKRAVAAAGLIAVGVVAAWWARPQRQHLICLEADAGLPGAHWGRVAKHGEQRTRLGRCGDLAAALGEAGWTVVLAGDLTEAVEAAGSAPGWVAVVGRLGGPPDRVDARAARWTHGLAAALPPARTRFVLRFGDSVAQAGPGRCAPDGPVAALRRCFGVP